MNKYNEEDEIIEMTHVSIERFNEYRHKLQKMHRRAQEAEAELYHLWKAYHKLRYEKLCELTDPTYETVFKSFTRLTESIIRCFKILPKTEKRFDEEVSRTLKIMYRD